MDLNKLKRLLKMASEKLNPNNLPTGDNVLVVMSSNMGATGVLIDAIWKEIEDEISRNSNARPMVATGPAQSAQEEAGDEFTRALAIIQNTMKNNANIRAEWARRISEIFQEEYNAQSKNFTNKYVSQKSMTLIANTAAKKFIATFLS
jgi:RNase P protein component